MAAHRIENGYLSLAALRDALSVSDTSGDARLARAIEAASRKVDHHCGRFFYPAVQTRYLTPYSADLVNLHDADLLSVTTLKTDTTGARTYPLTWTAGTDYELEPVDAPDASPPEPYDRIVTAPTGVKVFPLQTRGVEIAGLWGYYRVLRRSLTTIAQAGLNASQTSVEVGNVTLDPLTTGQIIQIDAEQMLVTETADAAADTITIVRGWNGTTAAIHAGLSPIDILTFPQIGAATEIEAARLALRRHTPFGVQDSPTFGTQEVTGGPLDPDAAALLEDFVRRRVPGLQPVGVR